MLYLQLLRMMNSQLNILLGTSPGQTAQASSFSFSPFCVDLANLQGKRVQFRSDFSKDCIPLQSLRNTGKKGLILDIKEFSVHPKERNIAAIDSSCALIGETEDGAIYAGRVAAVRAINSKIQSYVRYGPVIFYLEPNMDIDQLTSKISLKAIRVMLFDRALAERFIRIQLERWVQSELAGNSSDAIILIDGGLKSSELEPKGFPLKVIEKQCEENNNQLLGISKASCLKLISSFASELEYCERGALFLDVTDSLRALLTHLQCRVLVVKFSPNATAFRVDSSWFNSDADSQVLSDLKSNDTIFRGYPETLRLAHHLSIFDPSTVNSIRAYLSRKYALTPVPTDDLRATVLGKLV